MTFLYEVHDGHFGGIVCSKSERSVGRVLVFDFGFAFVNDFLGMMWGIEVNLYYDNAHNWYTNCGSFRREIGKNSTLTVGNGMVR